MGFAPMTREAAREILRWRYTGRYAVYDMADDADGMDELLGGLYFASIGADGTADGFLCVGEAARIPTAEPFDWEDGSVDIGLGMRPDLCGAGGGGAFFARVVAFARARHPGARLRLTVAAWNGRAIRVYLRGGFARAAAVTHAANGAPYDVMIFSPRTQ